MAKTESYSWRIEPGLKQALEDTAREQGVSVATLLDEIVAAWLRREARSGDDEEIQRRLHAEARSSFGTLRGGDADLAEQASERLKTRLRRRRAADRPH